MGQPIITVVGSFAVGMTIRSDRMPVSGETLIGRDFNMGPGGKGSNQAVGVARLGAKSYFAGVIGDDRLGDVAMELYAHEDVNTSCLKRTPRMPTGVGLILLDSSGANRIILDIAANKLVDVAFVDALVPQLAASTVVMTVLEIPVAAAVQAMALGKHNGAITLMNPAPATQFDPGILAHVDYLTPNESELRILMGLAPDDPTSTGELARQLQVHGANTIVVTLGEQGALIVSKEQPLTHVLGLPISVVDTTGAGDSFSAGLAMALAEGKPLLQAVQFANCCGALACTQLGVIPAMAQRAHAEQLFVNHYGEHAKASVLKLLT